MEQRGRLTSAPETAVIRNHITAKKAVVPLPVQHHQQQQQRPVNAEQTSNNFRHQPQQVLLSYLARIVCLFVCHTPLTTSVAWSRTQIAAFGSLGLRYVRSHFASPFPMGSLKGGGEVELPGNGVDPPWARTLLVNVIVIATTFLTRRDTKKAFQKRSVSKLVKEKCL